MVLVCHLLCCSPRLAGGVNARCCTGSMRTRGKVCFLLGPGRTGLTVCHATAAAGGSGAAGVLNKRLVGRAGAASACWCRWDGSLTRLQQSCRSWHSTAVHRLLGGPLAAVSTTNSKPHQCHRSPALYALRPSFFLVGTACPTVRCCYRLPLHSPGGQGVVSVRSVTV